MKKTINHIYTVLLNDITSLGSLILYGVVIVITFSLSFELFLSLVLGIISLYAVIVPLRIFFYRDRPNKQAFSNWLERIDSSSFPSLHAGRMGLWCGIFIGYSFYPAVILISALVCVSRILLKKHHLSDVVFGLLLGIIIGVFV